MPAPAMLKAPRPTTARQQPTASAITYGRSNSVANSQAVMSNASVARAMQAAPPIGGAPRLDPERMLLTGQDAGGNASVAGFAQQTMQRAGGGRTAGCAPPPAMTCPPATSCPAGVINQVAFPVASSVLTAAERADIASVAAAWHAAGSGIRVRVDGYASVEGRCDRNWLLSCRRAQAVAAELEHPTGGVPGVPRAFIDVFAHGGTSEFSPALPPNRIATISIPGLPPTPPTPPTPLAPACALPVLLGANDGGCRKDPDFGHFDFPKITTSSEAKLTAWAYHLHGRPFRSWVTNFECELELDIVLRGLAGGEGHAAFAHFAAGTGRDVEHRTGSSTLANLATASPSFRATLAKVKKAIEEQLRDQAAAGAF